MESVFQEELNLETILLLTVASMLASKRLHSSSSTHHTEHILTRGSTEIRHVWQKLAEATRVKILPHLECQCRVENTLKERERETEREKDSERARESRRARNRETI